MDPFPPLPVQTISSLFVELEFDTSRKSTREELEKVGDRFSVLLHEIKKSGNLSSHLTKCKKLIIDIRSNKCERDITYILLYVFYEYFPEETVSLLYEIVPKHGSWRDIPGLCDIIRHFSGPDHPLIEKSIEYMNSALHYDHILSKKDGKISNIAKWIPRETSKYAWLFERLAHHWTKTYTPYLFSRLSNCDPNAHVRAINKSRQLYRKVFVELSKRLELIETKMCSGEWTKIDPAKINKGTFAKRMDALLGTYYPEKLDRMICKEKIISHGPSISLELSMGEFVIQALKRKSNGDAFRNKLINDSWDKFSFPMDKDSVCIPMVDVSESMAKSNSIYSAVGIALKISQPSGRILFLGNQPYWKTILAPDFTTNVKSIFDNIPPATHSNILAGVSLIINALIQSEIKTKEIDKMKLVLLSDMNFSENLYSEIRDLFDKATLPLPRIIFWNVSTSSVNLPCSYDTKNVKFLSGGTSSLD